MPAILTDKIYKAKIAKSILKHHFEDCLREIIVRIADYDPEEVRTRIAKSVIGMNISTLQYTFTDIIAFIQTAEYPFEPVEFKSDKSVATYLKHLLVKIAYEDLKQHQIIDITPQS